MRRAVVPRGWAQTIHRRLRLRYPKKSALRYRTPWQLLVGVILSAQCTDVRVNLVTRELFRTYRTPQDFVRMPIRTLERLIHSAGFYRAKAKNIKGAAKTVVEQFGGRVPRTMAEILILPGVARKTGNVVLSDAYGVVEGIIVDTHVIRLANRLGLTMEKDPVKIERALMRQLPRSAWHGFAHELVYHGRQVCTARKPNCTACPLADHCPSAFLFDLPTRPARMHSRRQRPEGYKKHFKPHFGD